MLWVKRLNDSHGAFTAATGSGPYFATLFAVRTYFTLGLNYVSLFAVDAVDAVDAVEGTSINTSVGGTSSMIGASTVFAFTVVAPPAISTASPLTAGAVGLAYSQSVATSGGAGALALSVTAGALPAA